MKAEGVLQMNTLLGRDLAECLDAATAAQGYLKIGLLQRANIRLEVLIVKLDEALAMASQADSYSIE